MKKLVTKIAIYRGCRMMTQNRKGRIVGVIAAAVFVCLTFIMYFQEYATYLSESDIDNSMEITVGNSIMQQFICEYDGLSAVQILFDTNQRVNTSMLYVDLMQNDEYIQRFEVKESLIADNEYLILRLDDKIYGGGGILPEIFI